ncbi:MAG: hypothetical protein R3304_07205 [Longimicrobiales bacterium]|nr:hypothetical protein [Longimicrobiales bacterium]
MTGWWTRIRGAFGMGLTWAAAWFAAGMALLLVVGFGAADVPFPLGFGLLGFLAGVTFSGVLRLTEGRRSFHQMSIPRFAGWGGVGGLLFSALFVAVTDVALDALLFLGPIFALAAAGCAAGSLALARVADDRERLDAGEEVDQVGLSEDEIRELLGGGN